MSEEPSQTGQERREKKLLRKRRWTPHHGQSLIRVYHDAVLKRLQEARHVKRVRKKKPVVRK